MSIWDVLSHAPVVVAVVKQLNFISRLSLCRVFPNLRTKIPLLLDFRHVVKSHLVELFSTEEAERAAEEILKNMQKTQTWMSGSFVLKCLTGLDFAVGDVDFFTNKCIVNYHRKYRKRRHIKYDFISEFSHSLYKVNIFDKQNNTVVRWNNKNMEDNKPSKAILAIREFFIGGKCLQEIIINESYPIDEYIRDIFDMSFLKNMYDGQTLRILDPDAVLKQTSTVNMFQAYYKCFRHVFGYEEDPMDAKHKFMERQYKRIAKYRKRGFVVDLDFTKDIASVEQLCRRWEQSEYNMTEEDLSEWDVIANKDVISEFEDKSTSEEEDAAEDLSDEN